MSFYIKAWEDSVNKVKETSKRIGASFPHACKNGFYDNSYPSWWTNGFWPGILWLMYKVEKEESFAEIAKEVENKLDEVIQNYYGIDHDAGFLWILSSVAQYKILKSEKSKQRALHVANLLAGRFNPKGSFIRAWNGEGKEGWAIVDCLMNLPLLYWASEETRDPRYRHIAQAHADMALKYFVREDGSVCHIVSFDPENGEFIEVKGGQGYAPSSSWSRGTAWALYGFALSYKYTKDERYLNAAKKVAHYFVSALPADYVPYWDFRINPEGEPRDTSAAAIAASGLIEISRLVSDGEKQMYLDSAQKILKSLYENYSNFGKSDESLLREGTSNKPEKTNINVGLIYGDYFFVEALYKLLGNSELFW